MHVNRPALSFAVWAALCAAIVGAGATTVGMLFGPIPAAVVLVLLLAAAAVLGGWLGRQLDGVRLRALVAVDGPDRASDPAGSAAVGRPPRELRELRRLDDAVRALQARIRVTDELAEQYRHDADSAGAGMFELLSGLVAAEEATRGQLAAELHDSVAQSLGAARRLLAEPCDPQLWEQAAALVEESEDALRATMARTRPPALRDGDLAAAVRHLRDDLDMRYGLAITLEWPTVEYPLPLATAVTVYRFFQEALLNVLKHADVDEAQGSLSIDGRYLTAVVRDNGPGFDLATQPVAGAGGRHVGLGLLRERARLAGGSVDVMSAPGAGTILTLRLPRPTAAADLPAARDPDSSERPEPSAQV